MTISFDIPEEVEKVLRRDFHDLDQAAKEAALVELYRQGKLTHHQLSQALGLSRFEIDALLKRHAVTEDLVSVEEFNRQVEDLRRMAKP